MAGNGSTRRHSNLIVGRQREREQLRRLLADSREGNFALALISGEAGIGKSTLVGDFQRVAHDAGWFVLAGGCYDLETTPPYGPWSEIIRAYPEDAELPAVPEELRIGGGMAGIDSQTALFDLVSRFFAAAAERRPLALILEDIHWADPASLDLLRYLARIGREEPFVIAATFRDDEVTSEHPLYMLLPALVRESAATRIELQRLSAADVMELVSSRYRLSSEDQDQLAGYLNRLAEGNPFFTTELLHALEERGALEPAAAGWRLGDLVETSVPSLVQQVIARRMTAIDGPGRIILDIVAVIGQDASLDLLEVLHSGETGELDAVLQRAFDHHLLLLRSDGRSVRFTHALVRQTVYDAILPLRRRTLHREVGEQLASRARPDPARVADHFHRAADERALDWLARAADQAQAVFAPETVILLCRQALELANQLEVEPPLRIYRLQGLALETAGDFDASRASHELALARARIGNDRLAEWQALLDLAALWSSRDYVRTGDYCRVAVELARTMDDPAVLGHSLNRFGNWQLNVGEPTSGVPFHEEALEIFRALGDRQAEASTLDLLALGHHFAGDTATALAYYERAIPLLREIDDRQTLSSALANAAGITTGYGLLRGTRFYELPPSLGRAPRELLLEAVELSRSIGWRSGESYACGLLGRDAIWSGEIRAGLRLVLDAIAIAESISHTEWIVSGRGYVAHLCLYFAARHHALELIDQTLSASVDLSSPGQEAMVHGALASAYTYAKSYDQARLTLAEWRTEELQPVVRRQRWFAEAELALAQGDSERALETIETLIASFPDDQGVLSPEISRLKGLILIAAQRLDEAETQLIEARDVARSLGLDLILWRIHASLRRLRLIESRQVEAHEEQEAALAIIADLAIQLEDDDLRGEFLRNARAEATASLPYSPTRAGQPSFAGLTPREIEVLRLVARGLTNEEASAQLFISPRTVDQHLRSIYNKLEVTNRTAASRVATEKGIL